MRAGADFRPAPLAAWLATGYFALCFYCFGTLLLTLVVPPRSWARCTSLFRRSTPSGTDRFTLVLVASHRAGGGRTTLLNALECAVRTQEVRGTMATTELTTHG